MGTLKRLVAVVSVLLVLCGGLLAHELVHSGIFVSAGESRIKCPRLGVKIGELFTGTQFAFGDDDTYILDLGGDVQALAGRRTFKNEKRKVALLTKDKLHPGVETNWANYLKKAVEDQLVKDGKVVESVTVEMTKYKGKVKYKTKPTPIGPIHSVRVKANIVFTVTTTLAGQKAMTSKLKVKVKGTGVLP
ncbi:MAG: hypothetical protein ACYS99_11750 [Planctomycetota bacterium]